MAVRPGWAQSEQAMVMAFFIDGALESRQRCTTEARRAPARRAGGGTAAAAASGRGRYAFGCTRSCRLTSCPRPPPRSVRSAR